jgi:ribA/ribD-fused uncharacterized protein
MMNKIQNLTDVYDKRIPGHFETDQFVFFWSGPFSNWHPSSFRMTVNGKVQNFSCAEQAMMLMKAELFGDVETAKKIMNTKDPARIKSLGRSVNNYVEDEWCKVREEITLQFLLRKFHQSADMLKILLATGNKMIVEASPYDRIWGIGMGVNKYPEILDPKNWRGHNLLGEAIMNARSILSGKQAQNTDRAMRDAILEDNEEGIEQLKRFMREDKILLDTLEYEKAYEKS